MEKERVLLSEASKIVRQFRYLEKNKTDAFNLFAILVQRDEVKHSRFIAELLNPQGMHNCGIIFLESFLSVLRDSFKNEIIPLDPFKTYVSVEKYIDEVGHDKSKGFIDILLTDFSNAIVVENKLDARDQDEQLFKYKKYCDNLRNIQNNTIVYLTINGKKASEESAKGLEDGKDYLCISYQKHILKWLYSCIELSKQNPLVNNAIVQYCNHIENIVYKYNIVEKLIPIIQSDLIGASAIKDSFDTVISLVANELRKEVKDRLDKEFENDRAIEISVNDGRLKREQDEYYSSIYIDVPNQPRFIVESFNTKGRHNSGQLFIGRFVNTKSTYEDELCIYEREDLLKILDTYAKELDREQIVDSIVTKVVDYLKKRI